jgi:hypothetical protein
MAQRNRVENRARATESKFYLPAGAAFPFLASQLERVRAKLFNHRV